MIAPPKVYVQVLGDCGVQKILNLVVDTHCLVGQCIGAESVIVIAVIVRYHQVSENDHEVCSVSAWMCCAS